MKQIAFNERNGMVKTLLSPWLTSDEAAIYCGIGRTTFDEHAKGVPHGGGHRVRRYHKDILDKWINNELPGCPFVPSKEDGGAANVGKRMGESRGESAPLYDPVTGKAFGQKYSREGKR